LASALELEKLVECALMLEWELVAEAEVALALGHSTQTAGPP